MTKEYNGLYWIITADTGNVLVNEAARVSTSFIYTPDEDPNEWEEISENLAPVWADTDDISDSEALSIITGGEV